MILTFYFDLIPGYSPKYINLYQNKPEYPKMLGSKRCIVNIEIPWEESQIDFALPNAKAVEIKDEAAS